MSFPSFASFSSLPWVCVRGEGPGESPLEKDKDERDSGDLDDGPGSQPPCGHGGCEGEGHADGYDGVEIDLSLVSIHAYAV